MKKKNILREKKHCFSMAQSIRLARGLVEEDTYRMKIKIMSGSILAHRMAKKLARNPY